MKKGQAVFVVRRVSPVAWLCVFLCLFLGACAAKESQSVQTGQGLSEPVVTGVSRVIIPANGGQTIIVPRHMGDAVSLWSSPPMGKRLPAAALALEASLPVHDIAAWLPATEHDIMRRYLYRMSNEQRGLATRVLARAKSHMPVVAEGVRRQGLPPEIACLPLVESAFEPQAVSPAGAAGLWQLMPATARRFGLTVNDDVDERFDVRKSTEAATAYLAYLYRFFGSWPLAIAAYNSGEGTMRNAMRKSSSDNLDSVTAYCRRVGDAAAPLREETLNFVPRFVAAVLLISNAEELGFTPSHSATQTFASMGDKKVEHTGTTMGQRGQSEPLALSGSYDSYAGSAPAAMAPRSMQVQ